MNGLTQNDRGTSTSLDKKTSASPGYSGDVVKKLAGSSIGFYQLVREIGVAAMESFTWLSTHAWGDKSPSRSHDPKLLLITMALRDFDASHDGCNAGSSLNHRCIDYGEIEDIFFYVMPFLDSPNLAQWFERTPKPLSEMVVIKLIIDLAEAFTTVTSKVSFIVT